MEHSITFASLDSNKKLVYSRTQDTNYVQGKTYYKKNESGVWTVIQRDHANGSNNEDPIPDGEELYEKSYLSAPEMRKNTYDDWHLVSKVRPAFAPPTQKTKYIDIPGASSQLDLSEAITGYPVFNNREGTFEFMVLNDYQPWYKLYADVKDAIHGKRLKAYLEDDKNWYYEGRFTVSAYAAGDSASNPWSKLTISYSVDPYKWYDASSLDDWLWDPFNFYTGVILAPAFKNIEVTSEYKNRVFDESFIGNAPFCPELIVDTLDGLGVTLRLVNPTLGIDITHDVPNGTTTLYDFVFYGNEVTLYYKTKGETTGHLSIGFRQGRL